MMKVLFIFIVMVSSVGWGQTKDANMYPTQQEGLLIPPGISEIENGGYGVGNGGDFVRARFIKVGFEIIDYLTNHEEGVAFTSTYSINVFALNSVLNTHVVLPTDEKPTDNRGQKVDAIFKNGNLYLYVPTWEKFLTSRDEMYLMVFHEMLRVTGHFDDHYVISRNLEIPSDLELSDKPPKSSNHIVCLCSQNENGNGYVKLLCVESQTQEIVIEITYDAATSFSNRTNRKRQLESCKKQRKNIVKHFGLPDDESAESDGSFSLSGYGGARGPDIFDSYNPDITFQIKGFSEKFGLTCVFWGRDFIASEKGAYWEVSDKICDGLKSALSLGTKSKPVELFFEDDIVVKYQFRP